MARASSSSTRTRTLIRRVRGCWRPFARCLRDACAAPLPRADGGRVPCRGIARARRSAGRDSRRERERRPPDDRDAHTPRPGRRAGVSGTDVLALPRPRAAPGRANGHGAVERWLVAPDRGARGDPCARRLPRQSQRAERHPRDVRRRRGARVLVRGRRPGRRSVRGLRRRPLPRFGAGACPT